MNFSAAECIAIDLNDILSGLAVAINVNVEDDTQYNVFAGASCQDQENLIGGNLHLGDCYDSPPPLEQSSFMFSPASVPPSATATAILRDVYASLLGSEWTYPEGAIPWLSNSSNACGWNGVSCELNSLGTEASIVRLNMGGISGLAGTIPPSIIELPLKYLDISSTDAGGETAMFSSISSLQYLNLSFTRVGGILSDALANCRLLEALDLEL